VTNRIKHNDFTIYGLDLTSNGVEKLLNLRGFLGVSSLTHSSWCVIPGDLVANIHHGVSSLTQPSTLAHTIHPRPDS